jgi:hypothetical protein
MTWVAAEVTPEHAHRAWFETAPRDRAATLSTTCTFVTSSPRASNTTRDPSVTSVPICRTEERPL